MGHTRGKVVLIDWWDEDGSNTPAVSGGTEMGFDGIGIKDITEENTYNDIEQFGGMGMSAYEKLLEKNIEKSQSDQTYQNFYVTFLSASDPPQYTPEYYANRVNKHMRKYLQKRRDNGKYGIILMDYPSHGVVDEIISNNPGSDIISCLSLP